MAKSITIKFWGVRGSITCAGPETARYGGHTSCVEMRCGDDLLIFDAGSGIRKLGEKIVQSGSTRDINMFLSHGHIDHLIGLPYFAPLFRSGQNLRIWAGGFDQIGGTKAAITRLMSFPLFPVGLETASDGVSFNDFQRGEELLPCEGIIIRTAALNHPGGATGYRVEYGGLAVCYLTDTELDNIDSAWLSLARDADVLIMDSTYTNAELPEHKGWGHASWQQVVDFADAAGVKTLCLFHHDPDHSDDIMDRIGAEVTEARPGTIVAREGEIIEV
ncbi:MAG: MBL fold metallo-hydrolase [Xanthobacteraceae bacterium]|nr:MBL fold metallo-hydrolase [Xanthobacteraceae bacterium]